MPVVGTEIYNVVTHEARPCLAAAWIIHVGHGTLIGNSTNDARVAGLEHFLQRYVVLRQPEYGVSADELRSVETRAPSQRFFSFAVSHAIDE
jgi:hypothetical protein